VERELTGVSSPQASGDSAVDRERVVLGERFDLLRPQVLNTLRKLDHSQYAFQLAEDYLDFRNLASLCHTDTVYPPENNPNAARIQTYIDKFKEAFTTELYQWYIEHGRSPMSCSSYR
jgi:nuclear pore complex protein Nup133